MHISEGVLSAPVLIGGGALTAVGTAIGLKRIDYDRIVPVAILTSAFFVASLIHVPIGPGSVHLVLNGLLGLVLGWACFPAILVALFLQAVFFQFGGFTVIGVNALNMAAAAVLAAYLVRPWLARSKTRAAAHRPADRCQPAARDADRGLRHHVRHFVSGTSPSGHSGREKSMRTLVTHTLALLLLCLLASSAYGHKIRVFAYSEGDTIIGETSFSGGKKAQETTIIVTDKISGRQLLTTKTDSSGQFTFPVPEEARNNRLALLIIADAGEGHRNQWLLEAADYLPETAGETTAEVTRTTRPSEPETTSAPAAAAMDEEQLRRIIDESLAGQLGPVKRQLAEMRERKINLQDILGGLGYIIGLAGIAAYIKSRQGDRHDS